MNIELGQIISQIIAFLIMLWILKRFAWKPLLTVMDERQEKIRNEFATIEQQKQEAKSLHKSYEEKIANIQHVAKKLGQEEVNKAREVGREIEEEGQKRAREMMLKAKSAAEEEKIKAQEELKKELVNLVIASTEAVLGKQLDKN